MRKYVVSSFVSTNREDGQYDNFMNSYHTQTPILLTKTNTVQYVINLKSTTFQVEYAMSQRLVCMPEEEAKAQLAEIFLQSMRQAADVKKVTVSSISVSAKSR